MFRFRGDPCGRGICCRRLGSSPADKRADALDALGGRADQASVRRRSDRRFREEESRDQDQGLLVREERALRRAQDRAACRTGAGHLLRRARSGRVLREQLPARPLEPELGQHRALGEAGLELQGQALWAAARSVDGRALLQQEAHERSRRQGAGELAALRRRLPRHGEEGEGQGHRADVARQRRPAVHRRAPDARGAAAKARASTITASCSPASCRGPTRASSTR